MLATLAIYGSMNRFWHERTAVLARIENYLCQRIPEIVEVIIDDEETLSNEANEDLV